MNKVYGMAAGIALLATGAVAQDGAQMKVELEKMLATSKIFAVGGGVMGKTVKGAPYSGQEVNETTQVLGDGTRIHNETRATVYRDSEGRVRRETGDYVTVWDPVANVNYTLNTKDMTAVKSPMRPAQFEVFERKVAAERAASGARAGAMASLKTADGGSASVSVKDGIVTYTKDGKTTTFPIGPDGTFVSEDGKIRATVKHVEGATGAAAGSGTVSTFVAKDGQITITKDGQTTTLPLSFATAAAGALPGGDGWMRFPMPAGTAIASGGRAGGYVLFNAKTEALGEQLIEGVKSRGSRQTSTIEAGKIGNDRPLHTVSERWYSDELQTEVMTRHSDPRTGEQTFRLTNINRGEPASYLFQVPSGYSVTERK